jgi:hypothetical protein
LTVRLLEAFADVVGGDILRELMLQSGHTVARSGIRGGQGSR